MGFTIGIGATWDGAPIAFDPPYVCCVIVWRAGEKEREYLVLHRTTSGLVGEEDWAGTPPSGARQPGESTDVAAARELREETGLTAAIAALPDVSPRGVALYVAGVDRDASVALDAEHDRLAWLPIEHATAACRPQEVADQLARVDAWLDAHACEQVSD